MNSSITFFNNVNQNLVSELDILNFIDEKTKNDFSKLEQLNKDLENFEIVFFCETMFDNNPKPVSELFKKFKIIVSNKLEVKNINNDNIHPEHDPNLWNVQCFDLFKYIFDEYYKGTKRQLTNIWFYLKEYQSNKYVFSATKDEYIIFIEENYSFTIKNFDKAENKYAEKEYGKMNEHRINFENSLK